MGDKFSNCLVVRRKEEKTFFQRLTLRCILIDYRSIWIRLLDIGQIHLLSDEKMVAMRNEKKINMKGEWFGLFYSRIGIKEQNSQIPMNGHRHDLWMVGSYNLSPMVWYFTSATLPTENISPYDMEHWKWVTMNIYVYITECWIAKCKRDDIDAVKRVLFTRVHNFMASNWISLYLKIVSQWMHVNLPWILPPTYRYMRENALNYFSPFEHGHGIFRVPFTPNSFDLFGKL